MITVENVLKTGENRRTMT